MNPNESFLNTPLLCDECGAPMVKVREEHSPPPSGSGSSLGGTASFPVNSTGDLSYGETWYIYRCPKCGNQIESPSLFGANT